MFKTFFLEMKSVFRNKWKFISWFIILFIPTLYGLLYANAYWKPFHNTEKLNIAIVNLDGSNTSKNIVKNIKAEGKKGIGKNQDLLKVDFDSKNIYENSSQVEEDVKNNKIDAALVINKNFTLQHNKIKQDIIKNIVDEFIGVIVSNKKSFSVDLVSLSSKIASTFKKYKDTNLVTFYNSLKHNYLKGEMTTIISNLSKFSFPILLPTWTEVKNQLLLNNVSKSQTVITNLFPEFQKVVDFFKNTIGGKKQFVKNYEVSNNDINGYGPGLSPFFISIALWAGSLVMLFLFKNKRNDQHVSTTRHYFGKSLAWISTNIIQSLLLTTFLWIQGFHALGSQAELYGLNLLIGIAFTLIVQAIGYMFRYGDLGEVVAVIILVLQLVSSSGAFPVATENKIFQVISYVIPFTYSVDAIREIIFGVDISSLIMDILIILVFPMFFVELSLLINIHFDKKHFKKTNNKSYKDFLIPMCDL